MRAAVIGAGVMGSAIAAHLANVGVRVLLLDLAPETLTADEARKGLTLASPEVRNRLARAGIERTAKAQPPAFYTVERAALVTPGNIADDLDRIRGADWVIEAVVEDLGVKQDLLARIEHHRTPDTVVSTNTSGLPVAAVAARASAELRTHFLGTHFFNPPRYMKLLEVIPTAETDPGVVETVTAWGAGVLGKGVVRAKDTPNFIANRIGTYGFLKAAQLMLELNLDIDDVDELTGPLIGRPRSATFRTADLAGLDVILHVAVNAYRYLPGDEERAIFEPPPFMREMARRGWLGEKSGGGFYRRKDGDVLALDHRTLEYRPRRRTSAANLDAARTIADPGKRLATLLAMPDVYGEFLRRLLGATLAYAARRIPEVSDDVLSVDQAMRWGFGWDHGPFELWDLLADAGATARLVPAPSDAPDAPPLLHAVRAGGQGSFYLEDTARRLVFDPRAGMHVPLPEDGERISLARLKTRGALIETNPGASLIDLGDGIVCLEFHSKMNTIGEDATAMGFRALERLSTDFDGLVIGNQGPDFSAGANLMLILLEAQDGNWDELDRAVRRLQQLMMAFRRSPAPIVAAPFGRTLGAGVEVCFAATRAQAAAETHMGMVEASVGLIPAAGGTMEMARRVAARVPADTQADLLPVLRWAFETIAMAKVSTSAEDARRLGLLREADGITINGDRLLSDAKAAALALARGHYRPGPASLIPVLGQRGLAAIESILHIMRTGNHITPHDVTVATKLGYVLCGGAVPEGTRVAEDYVLDLEREAFLSLLGMPATQDRIRHMLQTGRPLRN
ncbi:MAG: 3-hydroxyacyl-CoA dehydrogenase NAD-binding domain-containing protein [Armatimonadota bacterium]|nr:3-hydroxyacyl-CoA dehydrogenase NAD-binding domain-containing protein [Armatimonadota bacterium]